MWSLHNHTCYSNASLGFPDCINKVEDLIKKAKEIGLEGIAITDHEILSAHVQAEDLGKKYEIPVIFGNEIYLQSDKYYEEVKEGKIKGKYPHFILLAMDKTGHDQLRKISSRAWRNNAYTAGGLIRRPTKYSDVKQVIGEDKGHIIASSACIGGFLGIKILELLQAESEQNNENIAKCKQEVTNFIEWCVQTFGKDNFFIEMQPPNMNSKTLDQYRFNARIIKLAEFYDIKTIVTSDSHYLSLKDAPIHEAYLNSKQDEEREVNEFYATAYLMNEEEMTNYFKLANFDIDILQNCFENTRKIGSRLQEYTLKHTQIVPTIKLPEFQVQHVFQQYYEEFPTLKEFAYSSEEQNRYLIYRFEKAIQEKEKNKDIKIVLKRVEQELEVLKGVSANLGQQMSAYYITMSKIIELVWSKANSIVGVSRGSAFGFLTNYLLDVTQADPLDYGDLTPFWRHLSVDRPELPDIDFDTESSARNRVLEEMQKYFGENNVLNVCTFGTLSSKTALQVAGRGLGMNDDEVNNIVDTIPIERGQTYTIDECLNGNEELNKSASPDFKRLTEKTPELLEIAKQLEGLVNQRGIHASGVIITNTAYENINACMRAPKGQLTTQWDLHDTETMGGLKYDFLTVKTLDKIRKTMDILIKYGYMKWQGTLKLTYDKYLNPSVLNYNDETMWNKINDIPSLFQFDTAVGSQAVKLTKPKSIVDLSTANSLMRLMGDGGETPLNQYIRYKNNINNWYNDMTKYGLNSEEQQVLKKYLLTSYGMAESQEKLMLLSMDKKIAGFTLKQANSLRKAIAKKKPKLLLETEQLFYDKGQELQTRKIFLQYVWEEVFAKSKGYGFSSLHSIGYSLIALQQMNLYCNFPSIVWNTACLIVDSCGDAENEENKTQDYGKTAIAIDNLTKNGVTVLTPDINKSDFEFTPDLKENKVLFGIKGVTGVNDEYATTIINQRNQQSFISLEDFLQRIPSVKKQIINLIKAGMFDNLYPTLTRQDIMRKYFDIIIKEEGYGKKSLNPGDLDRAIQIGIFTEKEQRFVYYYNFYKTVTSKQYFYKKEGSRVYHLIKFNDNGFQFFDTNWKPLLEENVDYSDVEEGICFKKASLDKKYKEIMSEIVEKLNNPKTVVDFNKKCYNIAMTELWDKYCQGTISTWEMDSLSYYSHPHELANVNAEKYGVSSFFDLPEQPEVIGYFDNEVPQYRLTRIMGTVIDKNKIRHTVSLLTPQGIVNVKFYERAFNEFNQQISVQDSEGKKTILEKTWFTKGVLLLVTGMRRDDNFVAKRYKNSVFSTLLSRIKTITPEGNLILQTERIKPNDNNK